MKKTLLALFISGLVIGTTGCSTVEKKIKVIETSQAETTKAVELLIRDMGRIKGEHNKLKEETNTNFATLKTETQESDKKLDRKIDDVSNKLSSELKEEHELMLSESQKNKTLINKHAQEDKKSFKELNKKASLNAKNIKIVRNAMYHKIDSIGGAALAMAHSNLNKIKENNLQINKNKENLDSISQVEIRGVLRTKVTSAHIRSTPSLSDDNIVGYSIKGQNLKFIKSVKDWYELGDGNYIHKSCVEVIPTKKEKK